MKIYHNPRCSKSRQTLSLIKDAGRDVEIIEYLNAVPTTEELKELLQKLGLKAEQIVRRGEAIYKELYKGKVMTESQWIEAMIAYPKLMERPIVVQGNKAVLGRPPENVIELF